ncbi:hypothetical protein BU26DRAFT_521171 [Trematosphaeria pertusa]|uniref:Uncharacterized protein n=1 Tax=Trematosphaeria pertusa TaxID=390896 RepID=A0A6A6I861_9PLEO|nr:uncharacterized protein BU26DRAFT_521171 [Trematosphaeria pertusa]KAF2246734.1 hypothetical protein BU26DRAFT_521171 [Trematosphaeria pertusa]
MIPSVQGLQNCLGSLGSFSHTAQSLNANHAGRRMHATSMQRVAMRNPSFICSCIVRALTRITYIE